MGNKGIPAEFDQIFQFRERKSSVEWFSLWDREDWSQVKALSTTRGKFY